jgi:hypothetical protein
MPWEASLALALLQVLLPFLEKLLHGDTTVLGGQLPIPEAEVLPRMQHFLDELTGMATPGTVWDPRGHSSMPEAPQRAPDAPPSPPPGD